jgi:hypothetical protein
MVFFLGNIGNSWLSIYISAHVDILLRIAVVIYDIVRYISERHATCVPWHVTYLPGTIYVWPARYITCQYPMFFIWFAILYQYCTSDLHILVLY